jgi:hypothetical protein
MSAKKIGACSNLAKLAAEWPEYGLFNVQGIEVKTANLVPSLETFRNKKLFRNKWRVPSPLFRSSNQGHHLRTSH